MINWAGFASGQNTNHDKMKRERRELAKAFNEFTRLNPMATAGEFQGFIDTAAGGSNYLRGGMPAGDTLKAVVKSADDRRAIAEKERAQKDLTYSMDFMTKAGDMALGIMLNTKGTGDNGTYSPSDLASMGKKFQERFPGVDFSSMNINPVEIFNPRKKTEYIQDKLIELTPRITEMIQSAGGKIDMSLIEKTFSSLPTELWKPIQERALSLDVERKKTYARTENSAILREIEKAMLRPDADIYGTITGMFDASALPPKGDPQWENWQEIANENLANKRDTFARDKYTQMLNIALKLKAEDLPGIYDEVARVFGKENLPPPTDPLWVDLQEQALQQGEDKKYDRMVKNQGKIMTYILELKEKGITDIHSEVVKRFGAQNVTSKDSDFFKAIQLEADQVIADKSIERSREAQNILNEQRDTILANESFASALFLDDKETQLPKLKQFVENSLDQATIARVFGPDGIPDDYYMNLINLINEGLIVRQRKDITEARRSVEKSAKEASSTYKSDNIKKTIGWFGEYGKEKHDTSRVGKTAAHGQRAAEILANSFDMTQQAMFRIQQILTDPNLPEDLLTNAGGLAQLIASDEGFKQATRPLSEATNDIYKKTQGFLGRYSQMSVGEYRTQILTDIDSSINDAQADMNTILSRFDGDYDKQINALNDFILNLQKGRVSVMEELRNRQERSKDFSGWRTVGTPAWDDSKFFGDGDTVEASLKSAIENLMNEAQAKIDLANQKKAAEAALNPQPSQDNNTQLNNEQSAASQTWGDVKNELDLSSKLERIRTNHGKKASAFGSFFNTELEQEKAKLITSFLDTPGVRDKLKESPEIFNAFTSNPYEFMLSNGDDFVLNWWQTKGKGFMESLNINRPAPSQ